MERDRERARGKEVEQKKEVCVREKGVEMCNDGEASVRTEKLFDRCVCV